MDKNEKRFSEIVDLGSELNNIQDFDILLEKILRYARKFVNADAGTIYICSQNLDDSGPVNACDGHNMLEFKHTQNDTLQAKLPPGEKLPYATFKIPLDERSIAGYVACHKEILNIPDVYKLPAGAPYHFNQKFDKEQGYRTQSMLTIPLMRTDGKTAGVLQLLNAKDPHGNIIPFSDKDEPFVIYFANTATTVLNRASMTRALLERMIMMAELRDPKETGAHVNRVATYAVEIYERWAKKRKLDEIIIENNRDILRMAAMLHDVGKVAISDVILKKPAKFTPDEYEIMKTHTWQGSRLFRSKQSEFDSIASEVAINHHENWDGTGYPGYVNVETGVPEKTDEKGLPVGKKGEEIPLFGRIVALADVFDALSSRRVYKEAWDEELVLGELRKMSGIKFDPELVDIFFESLNEIKLIAKRYKDEE